MNSPPTQDMELRTPGARWVGGYFVAGFSLLSGLGLMVGAYLAAQKMGPGIGAFLLLMSGVVLALAAHVGRDAGAKRQFRIQGTAQGLQLHLPPARSLIHRVGWEKRTVPWPDIEAIETRLEAYSSFSMANMQRAVALRLRCGEILFVGEDRAQGTNIQANSLMTFVSGLSERFAVPVIDRGMAEGNGGILGAFFTQAPPWNAEDLGAERKALLWRRVARTGLVPVLVPLIVLVLALLFRP